MYTIMPGPEQEQFRADFSSYKAILLEDYSTETVQV